MVVPPPLVPELLPWNREWNACVGAFPVEPVSWLDLGDQRVPEESLALTPFSQAHADDVSNLPVAAASQHSSVAADPPVYKLHSSELSHTLIAQGSSGTDLPLPQAKPKQTLLTLKAGAPALLQISRKLDRQHQLGQPIRELHLIAHGSKSGIQLADQWITEHTLKLHAEVLKAWELSTIVLWTCEIGKNQRFVSLLQELTGAEIFSSTVVINRDQLAVHNRHCNQRLLSEIIAQKISTNGTDH